MVKVRGYSVLLPVARVSLRYAMLLRHWLGDYCSTMKAETDNMSSCTVPEVAQVGR